MTEPTPEDVRVWMLEVGVCYEKLGDDGMCDCARKHFDEIRAAVEAERERSWQAVLALSVEELRVYESAESSANEYSRHLSRHSAFGDAIAAIRKEPADD